MRGFITSVKVLLATGAIFGLLLAAPFLAVIAGVFFTLLASWVVAKLIFMDDDKN
jgi:hypothetical protein